MCGIVAVKDSTKAPVSDIVIERFLKQRGRGRNGFGFISTDDNCIDVWRFTHEDDAISKLKETWSHDIAFHHRAPTSSKNCAKSNHPLVTTDSSLYNHKYALIHNGIIHNHISAKKSHEDIGILYNSQDEDGNHTDSEALLHELALIIEGKKKKGDFNAMGGMAFILYQIDRKSQRPLSMFYGRNQSFPLKISVERDGMAGTVNKIVLASEGDGQSLEPNILFRYDYNSRKIFAENMIFALPPIYEPKNMIRPRVIENNKTDNDIGARLLPAPPKKTFFDLALMRVDDSTVMLQAIVDRLEPQQAHFLIRKARDNISVMKIMLEQAIASKNQGDTNILKRDIGYQNINLKMLLSKVGRNRIATA